MACGEGRWQADIEGKNVNLDWQRFELDLFEAAEDGLTESEVSELRKLYPQLLPLYSQAIMRFGKLGTEESLQTLEKFTSDKNILDLYGEVEKHFPRNGLEAEIDQLEEAFLRLQYHFPEQSIPKVKSMISAFTYSTVADDSILVIGLDNYLGKDFRLYPEAGIPAYKFSHFSKEYIVPDAIKAWLLTEFPADGAQNLIEQMIYHGKLIYLTSALLAETEEYLLLDYELKDLEWCQENSVDIWAHFLEMELLFATENQKLRKYLGDAPFIPGFPEGSPGRVGQWVGYEIVKRFMDKQPNLSLSDLMEIEDANRILRESKYKPS